MVYEADTIPARKPQMDCGTRQQLRDEFMTACAAVFAQFIPDEGQLPGETFDEIEKRADGQMRYLAALLCEKRLAADPLSDSGRNLFCPCCQKRMRIQEQAQSRVLQSIVGEIEMQRPYCVCDACGFCGAPLDRSLGIPGKGPSIARRELVCHAATKDRSFEKASHTLAHHSKIKMSDEGIRKLAETEGAWLVQARNQRVETCFKCRGRISVTTTSNAPLLVITCDGGMVQTTNPEERWKSDKIGCVYDAYPQPDQDAGETGKYHGAKAITKTYVATMEPWKDFGPLLFTEACSRGYMDAGSKIFISDGAESIIELRKMHFADAHHIIDWFHAAEHVHNSGKAAFGAHTEQAQEWSKQVKDWLWDGELQKVIAAISKESQRLGLPPKNAPNSDPRVVLHRDVGYFCKNQNEMDYPT